MVCSPNALNCGRLTSISVRDRLGCTVTAVNTDAVPELGAIRFAEDGTLEVYNGTEWVKYQPPADNGYGTVFRGNAPPATDEKS